MVDGKAVVRPVRTGPSNLADTMILEGVAAGDVVVTGPYRVLERLKDGDAIREETAKDAAAQLATKGAAGPSDG
jgi:HlyD family secretion protein